MAEDGHLPNISPHVSRFQLYLQRKCDHKLLRDEMASVIGDYTWSISKMEEEFGCVTGIFGLLGQYRTLEKGICKEEQSVKDHRTA